MIPTIKRAVVYIDGFNLYFRIKNNPSLKWLDVSKLCLYYFPNTKYQIKKIKYFTAFVSNTKNDPGKSLRQQIYVRALETINSLKVITGLFKVNYVKRPVLDFLYDNKSRLFTAEMQSVVVLEGKKYKRLPIVKNKYDDYQALQVKDTKEKGSDVNLASHLLNDGFHKRYDVAIIISNDSDLKTPIKMVAEELGFQIEILNPDNDPKSNQVFKGKNINTRQIENQIIKLSQFPETIQDKYGIIKRPKEWWAKVLIFVEGTILMHPEGKGATREERVQQSRARITGVAQYDRYIPIGNAVDKARQWGINYKISYLTSRTTPIEILAIKKIISDNGFPEGEVYYRQAGETYGDVVNRIQPNIIIEDDCESIGNKEMVTPQMRPSRAELIKPIVVKEFAGIDELPNEL